MTHAANLTPAPLGLKASAAPQSWSRVAAALRQWSDRRQSRIALGRLNAHLVRDIGLDPLTAEAEAARPFWR
ncbi:DUF1127 domain-containing protein [Albidovulum sp.]|uniref:DUF1127 domain-containing protein n=1 Tax=Albidovulum sp. TaxID=1872424 RepID=UPI0039B91E77